MRASVRFALRASLWLTAGALVAMGLTLVRDAVPDAPVPYARPIDLGSDIRWIRDRLPAAATEPLKPADGEYGWRMNGMRMVMSRFGEEIASFTLWRVLPDGTVERDVDATAITVERLRRGWPFHCVEGAIWQPGLGTPIPDALARMPSPTATGGSIPMRLLPLGLLANAAIYGLALATLFRLPGAIERVVRRSRRRCPQCNHDPAGAARCPECGAEIP